MQLKSRYVLSALAVLVVFTMATTAMAQVTFNVSSTPTARARIHGHAELIGDVTFTVQTTAAVAAGTHSVSINYGIPITNDEAEGTAAQSIQIVSNVGGCFDAGAGVGADGLFASVSDAAADADAAFNYTAGTLTLTIVGGVGCTAGDFISVRNVHASVVGLPNVLKKAQVSTSPTGGYLIASGQDQPTIIATILDELNGGLTGTSSCLFLSNGTPITNTRSIKVAENFADAILTAAQLGGGALNDVQVKLTFSGIPTGASITAGALGITIAPGAVANPGTGVNAAALVATSTTPTMTIVFNAADVPSPILNDTLTIPLSFSVGTATLPLAATTITVTADIVPTGTATKVTPAVGNFPRFASDPEAAVTACTIAPAQTTMLVPFLTASSAGFNSGIAIANTTADNFGTPNGAVAQTGTILFEFWPQNAAQTPFTYTTSATSPGNGLTAGSLAAGRTYSVLLSELLSAAGAPADFAGYMIVTTNFTNAHGDVFITDFSTFTSAGQVLVMNSPSAGNSRSPAPLAEALAK
jgi:hypothetical protein